MTILKDQGRRPRGVVRLYEVNHMASAVSADSRAMVSSSAPHVWRRGKLLWECDNLVVNSGLTALASLIAGVTSGEFVAACGFGSGNTAPAGSDTDLTASPKYYNAIGSHTIGPSGGVAAGSVLFNYSLLSTDYAANPLTIQELGLFAGTASLPAAIGTTNPSWAATTATVVGHLIVDSNGNIQRCTTAGNTGSSAPTWAATVGSTTNDSNGGGTVVWTLVALQTAPAPMIAHVVVPSFAYSGGGNYAGTWTLSM